MGTFGTAGMVLLTGAGLLMTLYGAYFLFMGLLGFIRPKQLESKEGKARFALLIAARNEEAVIGHLVDSLQRQNYPRELYDIIVAPNNCTDDTAQVATAHGAQIFLPQGPITSKGQVLQQMCSQLMQEDTYQAICVFDADNLVHSDFLQHMNQALLNGAQAAQGFRDSKNPTDSAVSTCYSIGYWMLNQFYNQGRQWLGRSALINGSGFMVSLPLLRQLGGWHTCTMTEDYEFTAQCVLAGHRVHYVPRARIYDEQPLNFWQSWRQRRRWSTGSVQSMYLYLRPLLQKAWRDRDGVSLDLALSFATPGTQLASLALSGLSLGMFFRLMWHGVVLIPAWPLLAAGAALAAIGLCCLVAALVVYLHHQNRFDKMGRGILFFWIFLLSCMPIALLGFFKPQKSWDAIAHTRAMGIQDVADRAA